MPGKSVHSPMMSVKNSPRLSSELSAKTTDRRHPLVLYPVDRQDSPQALSENDDHTFIIKTNILRRFRSKSYDNLSSPLHKNWGSFIVQKQTAHVQPLELGKFLPHIQWTRKSLPNLSISNSENTTAHSEIRNSPLEDTEFPMSYQLSSDDEGSVHVGDSNRTRRKSTSSDDENETTLVPEKHWSFAEQAQSTPQYAPEIKKPQSAMRSRNSLPNLLKLKTSVPVTNSSMHLLIDNQAIPLLEKENQNVDSRRIVKQSSTYQSRKSLPDYSYQGRNEQPQQYHHNDCLVQTLQCTQNEVVKQSSTVQGRESVSNYPNWSQNVVASDFEQAKMRIQRHSEKIVSDQNKRLKHKDDSVETLQWTRNEIVKHNSAIQSRKSLPDYSVWSQNVQASDSEHPQPVRIQRPNENVNSNQNAQQQNKETVQFSQKEVVKQVSTIKNRRSLPNYVDQVRQTPKKLAQFIPPSTIVHRGKMSASSMVNMTPAERLQLIRPPRDGMSTVSDDESTKEEKRLMKALRKYPSSSYETPGPSAPYFEQCPLAPPKCTYRDLQQMDLNTLKYLAGRSVECAASSKAGPNKENSPPVQQRRKSLKLNDTIHSEAELKIGLAKEIAVNHLNALFEKVMNESILDPRDLGVGRDSHGERFTSFKVTNVTRIYVKDIMPLYRHQRERIERDKPERLDFKIDSMADWMEDCVHREANEVCLFHGTNTKNAKIIMKSGFDERVSNLKGTYGAGIYFSENADKADQYSPGKTMFLARVVLGWPYLTSLPGSWRRPPPIDRANPAKLHDSIVAVSMRKSGLWNVGVRRHQEFVIFDRYQCVPEFFIEYERI